eukprot:467468_1
MNELDEAMFTKEDLDEIEHVVAKPKTLNNIVKGNKNEHHNIYAEIADDQNYDDEIINQLVQMGYEKSMIINGMNNLLNTPKINDIQYIIQYITSKCEKVLPAQGAINNSRNKKQSKNLRIHKTIENPLKLQSNRNIIQKKGDDEDINEFERMDTALGNYYANNGRSDYYDANGDGKFMTFAFIEDIDSQLGDNVVPNNCAYIYMDDQFPLQNEVSEVKNQTNTIFKTLQCCYKYSTIRYTESLYSHIVPYEEYNILRRVVSLKILDWRENHSNYYFALNVIKNTLPTSFTDRGYKNSVHRLLGLSKNCILTWDHIANAISHELYHKISVSFLRVVCDKAYESIDDVLKRLQQITKSDKKEIDYLKQIINKAKSSFLVFVERKGIYVSHEKHVDDKKVKKNEKHKKAENILCDVFNVHNYFLFSQYNLQKFDNAAFMGRLPKFDLSPEFIIDDDMYDIWKYFFAASHLVHQKRQTNDIFTLKITVIPNKVICIYDKNIIFPFDTEEIDNYLRTQRPSIVPPSQRQDLLTICEIFEHMINIENATQIIIDRRNGNKYKTDRIYGLPLNRTKIISKLDENYFMSLSFTISCETTNRFLPSAKYANNNIVQCHLFYGLNAESRMRFYPEYVTSIIPRFFQKNNKACLHNIQNLFDDCFKHGFAVDLTDPDFNIYYKIATKHEHISVNYNRKVLYNEKDAEYAYKNVQYHKLRRQCDLDEILDIDECPFIEYIIDCLILTEKHNVCDIQDLEYLKKIDLKHLKKCTNHIIYVHCFFSKYDQRTKIQKYVSERVGECKCKRQTVWSKHLIEIYQETIRMYPKELNALHFYLLHIRQDEMDEFIFFVRKLCRDDTFIKNLIIWLNLEEYDWDGLLHDIAGFEYESNIHLFLIQHGKSTLFDILHRKYAAGIHDKNSQDIKALGFGKSVLRWFAYGDSPKYVSFTDEILNSPFFSVSTLSLETYTQSAMKLQTSAVKYKWKICEILSLLLYTNETGLCASFRKSFWDNNNLRTKRHFYWWAITIYKTFSYHANPLPQAFGSDKPITLYHGIHKLFVVNQNSPKYHGPVSTTLVHSVAQSFSNIKRRRKYRNIALSNDSTMNGLLWSIDSTYYNPFSLILGIDVSWISKYGGEAEILLHDQYLHITSTINFAASIETKVDMLLGRLKIYKELITDEDLFWRQMGFHIDNQSGLISIIKTHPLLLQYSEYTPDSKVNKTVLHRLVNELHIYDL